MPCEEGYGKDMSDTLEDEITLSLNSPSALAIDVHLFTHGSQKTNMVPYVHCMIRTNFR
jgi:hypothetical protein